ncbi:nose resistant to fluoxetine protein 6, partial [Biomphalaria glabrata]
VPLFIGWFVCIAVVAILPYITYSENKENGSKWSDVERSLFEALSRPSWALCVAWIIFACCNGQG